MCLKSVTPSAVTCLFVAAMSFGQAVNVNFQLVPFPGTTVNPPAGTTVNPSNTPLNPAQNPVVVVQPGTVIPFELLAQVTSGQATTTAAGLAAFNLNVNTNFGVAQNAAFAFGPVASPIFTVNRRIGTSSIDDVLGIAGAQNTAATPGVTTDFALNSPQVIGTGQLITPNTEGTFTVNLASNATVFNSTNSTTTATVPTTSTALTVITRSNAQTQTDASTDTSTNNNTAAANQAEPRAPIEGGVSQASGRSEDEQATEDVADGPTLTSTVGGGICGAGVVSAALTGLLGLGLLKRRSEAKPVE